ncbi:hypothetical protein GCM10010435_17860 [Winogradskya consettensis]|uniref:Lipoprotein n=1 Tax=Winogradskya consettensis TaxID=113560 RepID=A0A919SW62_9ACTN|nr:hypothetical protein [Actinoplanes consettensis]GIM78591.1 hypothetical protein Aco04nite_61190 [Actinoplanes consettensis]
MNRRFAAVLVPLLGLSLAACTDDPPTIGSSTSGIKAGNYTFTTTLPGDSVAKGVVDSPSHAASVDFETLVDKDAKATISYRVVGTDRFVKITTGASEANEQLEALRALGGTGPDAEKFNEGVQATADMFSGKKWLKLDLTKVKAEDLQLNADDPDVAGVAALLAGATTTKGDDKSITGTVDLTGIKGDSQILGKSAFEGLDPTQGKAIPYVATLDKDGRLTKLVLDMPKVTNTPAGKWTVDLTGYGSSAKPEVPPAAEVDDAPDSAYEMLNGEG